MATPAQCLQIDPWLFFNKKLSNPLNLILGDKTIERTGKTMG
jgi:hypothetical protein